MPLNAAQAQFLSDYLGIGMPDSATADAEATFKALRGPLVADLAALNDKDAAREIATSLKAADQRASAGSFQDALVKLDQITTDIAAAKGAARATGAVEEIPEGVVAEIARSFEVGIAELQAHRLRTVEGLGALSARLRKTNDTELHAVADQINTLSTGLPNQLEETLAAIKGALEARDVTAATALRSRAQSLIDEASAFLTANRIELALCEKNPFDAPMDIIKPLDGIITRVRESVARL